MIGRALEVVRNADLLDLLPRMTLLLLVLNTNEDPPLFIGAVVLCAVAFRVPRLYRSPWLWLAAGTVLGIWHVTHWEGLDDHVVVTTYWVIALGLSLMAPDPHRAIALNGRLLIGLVFAFAAFWKLYSPDFVSGRFFRYTLLLDDRFGWLARSVGGLSRTAYDANFAAVGALRSGTAGTAVPLVDTAMIRVLAGVMTAWGLTLEVVAAASLLAPLQGRLRAVRHVAILAFCATTYLVVPIGGFGCLLAVLGVSLAQDDPKLRVAYVVVFAALVLYAPLWVVTLGP